jgi:multidrug transporter EmrE-like cation transporter
MNLGSLGVTGAAVTLSAVESVADYQAKAGNLPLTLVGYGVLGYVLHQTLRANPLGVQNLQWNAITNVGNLLIGSYFFGEKLGTNDVVAAILITTGIGLLMLRE